MSFVEKFDLLCSRKRRRRNGFRASWCGFAFSLDAVFGFGEVLAILVLFVGSCGTLAIATLYCVQVFHWESFVCAQRRVSKA